MRLRFFNTFVPVAPLFTDLVPHLAAHGHHVDVLVSRHAYRAGEERGDTDGVSFFQMPAPNLGPARRLSALFAHASFASGAASLSALGRQVDLNVFMTQPPLFGVWGRALERLRRQAYAYVLMDLYPWVLYRGGVLTEGSRAARALEGVATAAIRGASIVVVIGRCMANRIADLGVDRSRIHIIHNWADTGRIRPIGRDENALRRRFGLEDKWVVMYSGNHGVCHFFDDILEVARRLQNQKKVVFLFVGGGARRRQVRDAASRLDNIRCLEYQRSEDLAASLSMGDVHFVSLRHGSEGLMVPSKTYGILAAGRPIIYQGAALGEVARLITEKGIGEVVPQDDPDGLERAILAAREDEAWCRQAGARARQLVESELSMTSALETYRQVLTGEGGAPA